MFSSGIGRQSYRNLIKVDAAERARSGQNRDPAQAGSGRFESDPYEGPRISYDTPALQSFFVLLTRRAIEADRFVRS
jgi:hypothetical protein